MNLKVKSGARLPAALAASKLGMPEAPNKRKPASSQTLRSPTKTKSKSKSSVEITPTRMLQHMNLNGIPEVAGADPHAVRQTALDVATEFNGKQVNVDMFSGRLWERLLMKVSGVRRLLVSHLNRAIRKQLYFLQEIYDPVVGIDPATGRRFGGTGFFNANGENIFLNPGQHERLVKNLKKIGAIGELDLAQLARMGIVYFDRFRINGSDFVDGAFVLQFEGLNIVLLRVEAKTMYSAGVDGQLGAFFVRLGSSSSNERITCHQAGQSKANELKREDLLFNPTWTDAGVGVQEWGSNFHIWADARLASSGALLPEWQQANQRHKTLSDRLDSAVNRGGGISRDELERLAVSGPVIYAKVDLRGVRRWFARVVTHQK